MNIKHIIATNQLDADGDKFSFDELKYVITKTTPPILLDHKPSELIGYVIDIDLQEGKLLASMNLKEGNYSGLYPSIGFIPLRTEIDENDNRIFKEIRLLCVGLHANPNADSSIKPLP